MAPAAALVGASSYEIVAPEPIVRSNISCRAGLMN